MPQLSALHIFPVKSLRGSALETAQVERRGLHGDRRMMVVDADGRFLTQRELPRMALAVPRQEDERLTLTGPGMPDLTLALSRLGRRVPVQVWSDFCEAVDQGDPAAEWLSDFLGKAVRLVRMAEETRRRVNPQYAVAADDAVSFADAYPILILSEASLEALNARLAASLPMNRFRPNLVVRGCQAFAEDTWKRIRIDGVEIALVKPCARCEIITTDQETAERGKEPLKTLAAFRRIDGKAMFGQNAIPLNEGAIRVGATVEILG